MNYFLNNYQYILILTITIDKSIVSNKSSTIRQH